MKECVSVKDPEAYLASLIDDSSFDLSVVCFRYLFEQYYLPEAPSIELLGVSQVAAKGLSWLLLCPWSSENERQLMACKDQESVRMWAVKNKCPFFDLSVAISLKPIAIPKPWGQEIWYTGIEARGQSLAYSAEGEIPLPWLMSCLPLWFSGGREKEINLLKILDPLSEPVYGDLYFEQHQEKQEVYVVTHIDESAWQAGEGGIFIGFDPDVRAEFNSDDDCVSAFYESIKQYEVIRREIDGFLDLSRSSEGMPVNEPVKASTLKRWLCAVPDVLKVKEERLRHAMDRFKGLKRLRVGDVLKVPCYTPHSLLHGVRTIEFQTPVYERQIISFAQKVLTQDRWDTAEALDSVVMDVPQDQTLPVVVRKSGVLVEEVVSFDSFYVWRVTLGEGAQYPVAVPADYGVVIGVKGVVNLFGCTVSAEEAFFVQKSILNTGDIASAEGMDEAVFLMSFPK